MRRADCAVAEAPGLNVTLIVQVPAGATDAQPAAGVAVNDPGLVPPRLTPEIDRVDRPVLVTVRSRAADVVLTV